LKHATDASVELVAALAILKSFSDKIEHVVAEIPVVAVYFPLL
jgi:hypothetical protein